MRRATPTLAVVAALAAFATIACAETGAPAAGGGADPGSTADGVVPLAKAPGWRAGLGTGGTPFGVLEIAYDRDTAERAWRDNLPGNLPPATGVPDEPGVYADLDAVDFDRQAVVVWSSGESGSCPDWLADVRTGDDGTVEIERRESGASPGDGDVPLVACTDDYRPYRMVLAVDRDRLPDPESLPTDNIRGVPDGRVTAYPAR